MSGNQEPVGDAILVYLQENAEFHFWQVVWVLPTQSPTPLLWSFLHSKGGKTAGQETACLEMAQKSLERSMRLCWCIFFSFAWSSMYFGTALKIFKQFLSCRKFKELSMNESA